MVNIGSMIARSGIRQAPVSNIFTFVSVSLMIVNLVASEPVPAVVGMATRPGLLMSMSLPMYEDHDASDASSTEIALAVSIGEPPPKAIRKSHPEAL